MQLRPYQRAAVDSIGPHFERSAENALIVVPTGGGKTPIIATFLKETLTAWPDTRVLYLCHVAEIIEQSFKTLLRAWPDAPTGVYAAGLGMRNLRQPITMASIQSIYKRAYELQRIDLVLLDECQMMPHSGDGMYRKLFEELLQINPYMKVVGLTATHWRLGSGILTEGNGAIFSSVTFEVTIRELLDGGYLVPPITKTMATQIDTGSVGVRGGEFVARDLAAAADQDGITREAVAEIVTLGANRRSWLAFCSGVQHALHVRDAIRGHGISCETVTGETPKAERRAIFAAFRAGQIRCLTGCEVFLVGFDAPATDMLAVLRPTKSSALWLQLIGRGLRLSPETGKQDCLVLDYTQNSNHFGPIDLIRPKSKKKGMPSDAPHKECPECEATVQASALICPECGYEFPPHEIKIDSMASNVALLSTQQKPEWLDVTNVSYRRHEKEGKPPSMQVSYQTGLTFHREWICLEHSGFPRTKAVQWWQKRAPACPVPNTVDEALANRTALAVPQRILVKPDGKWTQIVGVGF